MQAAIGTSTPNERRTLTPEEREELILRSMPLVYSIARRLISSLTANVSLEDLVSAGTVGLIHAVDNFEPDFEVKLQSYAAHRIRGAMLDNVRANDWLPRRQRAHLKRLQDGMLAAQTKHQRFHVSDEEVAAELEISVEQYRTTLASLPITRVVSIEEGEGEGDGGATVIASGDVPSQTLEKAEMAKLLENALGRLTKEEQTVLSLHYEEDMSPQEIARITNLPVKRIYQVKAQAILRLRTSLHRRILRKPKS